MKNLLIYINPTKTFTNPSAKFWKYETDILVKIQVDNSFRLGWKAEDIILVTNFPYEYNGVKAMVVGDENYCDISPTASKINTIINLFESGVIKNELYWFHDFDAFQLEWITEEELELDGIDFGITEYGMTTINEWHNRRLSTGSIFFNNKSKDIFEEIKRRVYGYHCNEEVAFLLCLRRDKVNIKGRMKRLNITYNFATRKRQVDLTYELATKPLKVIHFHPLDERPVDIGNNNMDVCVYGKNRLNKVLVPEGLIEIFKKHGIAQKTS